tara:strand:- start:11 stop:3265 length:3255 start_codon:yes stop_codon:yes gene_type:complete
MAKDKIINVKVKGLNDLKKLKKELDVLQKSQDKGQKSSKKSESQFKKVNATLDKATKKVKANSKAIDKNRRAKDQNTKASKKMGGSFLKTAAIMGTVVLAFRAISRVATKMISTFTDFEFSMAKVRAISGANTEQFRELEQSAKELGRTTFFTAKQVAELQVNFSKLGFTAEQIMDLQEATLDLAMATGSDLARSAMVAGSAVRGFNLDASESTRVVDVMAVAFTNSALDIEKWQTSMTKVSSIAAAMGVDIEGTAAVMGVLSDAGIEASIGGTSLRNIFLKMANPTSALAKRIGFVVESTDDMIRALKKLKAANLEQLELQGLVDVRQVIAFQRMIDGIDTIEDYTEALRDSNGEAAEMARIMEDSTKGSFKRFTSALEGMFIAISENLAPWINKVTKSITKFVGILSKASEIRISDKLNKDARAMNNLFDATKNLNNSTDTRQGLLDEINDTYGDLIGHQLTDIDNITELDRVQKLLNETMMDRAKSQAIQEAVVDFYADQLARENELLDVATDIEEAAKNIDNREFQEKVRENKEAIIAMHKAIGGGITPVEWAQGMFGIAAKPFQWIDDLSTWIASNAAALIESGVEEYDLSSLIKRQIELIAEQVLEPEQEAALKKKADEIGLKIDDILKKNRSKGIKDPCEGILIDGKKTYWNGTECVPLVTTPTKDFAEAIALFEVSITSKMLEDKATLNENYIADESDRALALLEEKERLAKEELDMYKIGDKQRAKFHLKWVKSMINVEKHKLSEFNKALKLNLKKEKRLINQMFNDGLLTANQRKRAEIQAEKDMLDAKLKEYKKYGKEVEKIEDQLAANKQKLNNQEEAEKVELKNGLIQMAGEIANATISILSQSLEREMSLRRDALDDEFNREVKNLDRKLKEKKITQADYNHFKNKADLELAGETERLEREQFRKKKNIDRAQALINGAVAIGKIISQTGVYAPIPLAIAATTMAAQLAIIESTSYYKKGGLVEGASHEQGGVKFAVGGRVAELEGGEAVINKRSTAMFRPQLSAMNRAGGGVKFADGGLMNMPSFTTSQFTSAAIGGGASGGATKVVVVESEITNSQSQVKTIQTNASF